MQEYIVKAIDSFGFRLISFFNLFFKNPLIFNCFLFDVVFLIAQ